MVKNLTLLQRHILAELEEAGVQNFCDLTNTAAVPKGSLEEIEIMKAAIAALIRAGLVYVSKGYDFKAEDWPPLSDEEALSRLHKMPEGLEWSPVKEYWLFKEGVPPEICLTDAGFKAAREILSDETYSAEPLASYGDNQG